MTKIVFSHINPIPISNGKLLYNQDLNLNYRIDYIFKGSSNVFLQDIGIEFFNVGDDDTSKLFIEIYDQKSKNKILVTDTLITEIYNQTVYINTNIQLFPNTLYEFVIGSRDKENDDKIHLFKANTLPFNCEDFPLVTNSFYADTNNIPSTISSSCPFLNFGIGSQIGIDFIAEQKIYKYPADIKATNFYTEITPINEDLIITKIGLDYLDIGNDSIAQLEFYIKDDSNNILFSKDTIIRNVFKRKFDINCQSELLKDKKYHIGLKNLNQKDTNNIILAYKTDSLPYLDNIKLVKILSYQKNQLEDSLGIAFYLGYKYNVLGFTELKNNKFKIEKNGNQSIITFTDNTLNYKNINIIDLNGKIVYSDIVQEKKIHLKDNLLTKNSIYLIQSIESNFIIKFYYP